MFMQDSSFMPDHAYISKGTPRRTKMILPNSFTFSYKDTSFTACQHDILILIFEKLQVLMTNTAPLDKEMFGEQKVVIDASLIMKGRNKEHVLQSARALMSLEFGFRYIRDDLGNVNRVWGVFVTTVEDIKGSSFFVLTINRDILPVLTYYGPSVGGTLLLRDPELETKGRHAKIIRSMLISRRGMGSWKESLDDFRMMLGLSTEYRPSCLKKDILEPVRRWLLENSDVWFEYELLTEKVPGRKAHAEAIFFWVYSTEKTPGKREFSDYSLVHSWMRRVTGDPVSHRNIELGDGVMDSGMMHHMAEKCRFYGSMVRNGEMEVAHAVNIIRKILYDDFSLRP